MFSKLLSTFIFLSSLVVAKEIDLSSYEKSFYSQSGEDGILAEIFQLIKPSSRFCVEFGAYDGVTGSNTHLLTLQGWKNLLLDRSFENHEHHLYKEFITAENINSLFESYGVPYDLDLLSIDISYNDFYVWKALNPKYRPAVVVIDHNAIHPPSEDKVAKYRPFFCGDGTNYFGASMLAMYRLGRSKGYSLVYAEKEGMNLFFIRDDLLQQYDLSFTHMNDVEKLYHQPTYGKGPNGGHRQDPKNREYVSSGVSE